MAAAFMTAPAHPDGAAPAHPRSQHLFKLALGSLGIVYGDIGTSPLYALKECFHGLHRVAATHDNVLGVLSLVFWSLTMVVSVKYLGFIMKADNKGEGGIFALLALIPPFGSEKAKRARNVIVLLALFGAALLYGDGVITPAISVLSAVEGLGIATHAADPFIVPLTCLILVALFIVQRRGTAGIGRVFGPVMLLWFFSLAVYGALQLIHHPQVLWALNPAFAVRFFRQNHLHGFVVLGSVVLSITGGEALYADMGHFGRRPIRFSWFVLVFPALLLNYFGQGAFLLANPTEVANPFFSLVPAPLIIPTVILATMATVIASQALISGAFSLTRQAVQLGFCPRVTIVHTSGTNEGQIYIPEVNSILMVACVALVLAFQKSDNLAAAYGIAVTGTMGITSIVYYVVVTRSWGWKQSRALPLLVLFLTFDLAYFGANLLKFFEGGWFPLVVGLGVYTLMTTWKTGRALLAKRFADGRMPLDLFIEDVARSRPHRVSGSAIFLSSDPEGAPPVLLHHLKHNQVLHDEVVLLSILSADEPQVPAAERVKVESLGHGIYRVIARYGFMETPKVPEVMRQGRKMSSMRLDPGTTSFYLGRETLLTRGRAPMSRWRKRLFAFVSKIARPATEYFNIPPGRVVELGMQIDL